MAFPPICLREERSTVVNAKLSESLVGQALVGEIRKEFRYAFRRDPALMR